MPSADSTPGAPDASSGLNAQSARVDPVARHRVLTRLAAAPQPPWLHGEVARRMGERLSIVRQIPQQVIDWSGEAGASAAVLQSAYPKAQCTHVARSPPGAAPAPAASWWARAWRGRKPASPVYVDEGSVHAADAQLVWSNMALHFDAEPRTLFAQWHRALQPDGFLMFSTLGPGSLELLRDAHATLGAGPAFVPFIDMHDLGDALVEAGFADPVMDQETVTLTYRNADAMLAELRSLGANLHPQRYQGLRTPRWQAHWQDELLRRCAPGPLALRFEIVYGHAFRGHTGPRLAAETSVSLNEMKALLRRNGAGPGLG